MHDYLSYPHRACNIFKLKRGKIPFHGYSHRMRQKYARYVQHQKQLQNPLLRSIRAFTNIFHKQDRKAS
jgi:hypothetical protein